MPSSKYRAQRFHSNIKESAIIVDYILEKYNDRSKEVSALYDWLGDDYVILKSQD